MVPDVELGEGPEIAGGDEIDEATVSDVGDELVCAHTVEWWDDEIGERGAVDDEAVSGVSVADHCALLLGGLPGWPVAIGW